MRKESMHDWCVPQGQRELAYDDVSCIVFQGDAEGRILSSNAPDPRARPGASFWELAAMTPTQIEKLKDVLQAPLGVWTVSSLGVGVLFSHFFDWVGCYVYLHIHDDPETVLDFVCGGAADSGILPCPYGMKKRSSVERSYDADTYVRIMYRLSAMSKARHVFCCAQDFRIMSGDVLLESLMQIGEIQKSHLLVDAQAVFAFGSFGYDNLVSRFSYLCWLGILSVLSEDHQIHAEFYAHSQQELSPLCVKLWIKSRPVEEVRQREDLNGILDAVDDVVAKGKSYDIRTDVNWDIEKRIFCVDIQCIRLPALLQPSDVKEPLAYCGAGNDIKNVLLG